jgi:transcriptional regulator GlxA family with amidase domain
MHRELSAGNVKRSESFEAHETAPHQDDPIAQACQYVHNHLSKPLFIDDVARCVYLSRTQFTQRFRREMNMSFNQYVNVERLKESCRLLKESEWSVEAIAAVVGTTPVHLRELFRRELEISPSQYRARSRRE